MKRLFMTLTTCIPILLCAFTGCETTKGEEMLPYNAIIIGDDGSLKYKEDFLKANMTYGDHHWNGDVDEGLTLPKFRTFIITEKVQLDEIFSVCPEIDFEKEMVVMYAYTGINNRQRIITSITLNNKILEIEFKIVERESNDTSVPQTRFIVIKIDKLDIDTVEFTLLNPWV